MHTCTAVNNVEKRLARGILTLTYLKRLKRARKKLTMATKRRIGHREPTRYL